MKHSRKEDFQNLQKLAELLALNYFQASSGDLKLSDQDENFDTYKDILKDISNNLREDTKQVIPDDNRLSLPRVVLVLGAGATYNAFKDFPLGSKAVTDIYKKIVVYKDSDNITFYDFSRYMLEEELEIIWGSPLETEKRFKLKSILSNKNHLLAEIGQKYIRQVVQWKLLNPDKRVEEIDFETALNILSSIVSHSSLREAIGDIYNFREGTTLFYQLVAHLFKHRFIDVIINFNFDEFLDQAIEDEIGKVGYDKILSDGDCSDFKSLTVGNRLRQPLYIKPHGTASYKSTLRFTKDHYHELPIDTRKFLENIFQPDSKKLEEQKKIILITVGFGMESIEFNEILSRKLQSDAHIFTFYNSVDKKDHFERLYQNIIFQKKDLNAKNQKTLISIPHIANDISKSSFEKNFVFEHLNKKALPSLDLVFLKIYSEINKCYKDRFQIRGITNHKIFTLLFGTRTFWNLEYIERKHSEHNSFAPPSSYPKYFNSKEYFLDRVVVEIVMSLAANRGKLQPIHLVRGRIGKYYAKYIRQLNADKIAFENGKDGATNNAKNKHDISFVPFSFMEIIENILLSPKENIDPMSILKVQDIASSDDTPEKAYARIFTNIYNKITNPDFKYFSERMRTHIQKSEIKKNVKPLFKQLRYSKKTRIQSQFRSPVHHVFQNHNPEHLINTDLYCDIHFYRTIKRYKNGGTLLIISDYAYQLSKFLDLIVDYKLKIYLIVYEHFQEPKASNFKSSTIKSLMEKSIDYNLWSPNSPKKYDEYFAKFEKLTELAYMPANALNQHMSIFLKPHLDSRKKLNGSDVESSIYYYSEGLSQNINPIRLLESKNNDYLLKIFQETSNRALQKNTNLEFQKFLNKHF